MKQISDEQIKAIIDYILGCVAPSRTVHDGVAVIQALQNLPDVEVKKKK